MHYLPRCKQLLTGSWDKTLKLHSVDKNGMVPRLATLTFQDRERKIFRTVNTFKGHTKRVNECKMTSNGQSLISTSMDQTCKLWLLQSKSDLLTFKYAKSRSHILTVLGDTLRTSLLATSATMTNTSFLVRLMEL